MKIDKLFETKIDENPLDNIVNDGGYVSILRTIGCIGDSLSSGEFEAEDENHNRSYHDFFEYSWGQFLARDCGVKVYNFSRGGMSCKEYMQSFANQIDAFSNEKACLAYIIALGVNDLYNQDCKIDLGSIDDFENKKETMARYYQEIIFKYKEIQPHGKFFLVTMPKEKESKKDDKIKQDYRNFLYEVAKKYNNTYVIDLYKYGPIYDDKFKEHFYLYGHMNAAGYRLTAKFIESYIDYIIRHNFTAFRQVGFIGKEQYKESLD